MADHALIPNKLYRFALSPNRYTLDCHRGFRRSWMRGDVHHESTVVLEDRRGRARGCRDVSVAPVRIAGGRPTEGVRSTPWHLANVRDHDPRGASGTRGREPGLGPATLREVGISASAR